MTWKDPPPRTSLPCLGNDIRKMRNDRGWTQERLADEAGFTSRLIRKAEAGTPLHPDTIDILAETLSTPEKCLAPEDLVFSDALVISTFYSSVSIYGAEVGYKLSHLFDDELVIWAAGEETGLPFAGTWKGLDGLYDYFSAVLRCYTFHGNDDEPEILRTGEDILVIGSSYWTSQHSDTPTGIWQVNRYRLRRGRILEWKNYFDTATAVHLATGVPRSD